MSPLKRVLVYDKVDINPDIGVLRSHTGGGADEALLKALGTEHGFEVVVTDSGADFTTANLAKFDVVAFSSPDYITQELTTANRAALEAFVRGGGGWIGWHYALWVEKGWPFLKELAGGVTVLAHVGAVQASTYTIAAAPHPVTQQLAPSYEIKDDFLALVGGAPTGPKVTVLATALLTAAPGGAGHPVIWVNEVGKGRVFYSMLGHSASAFTTPWSKTLMWNALRWAAHTN